MISIYRSKSPSEKLAIAFGLWRLAREVIANSLCSLHPDWTDLQIKSEVARRMLHGSS
ncbi:MAG TPA: hypothetical protein VGB72_03635 [Acidobacteriota bacterium]